MIAERKPKRRNLFYMSKNKNKIVYRRLSIIDDSKKLFKNKK